MATQKPIATISYNSEAFLREHLDAWIDAHIIQAYQYICHKGEDGDKDHIHLRVEPNKKLDPMNLSDLLREYTKDNPKPLGVRPWRPSKEEDWFLYAVHDKDYLDLKYRGGEKGEKIPYDYKQIQVSEHYDIDVAFIRAKATMLHTTPNLASRIQGGEDPLKLIQEGENVFTVNALVRALSLSDYERAVSELNEVQRSLDRLFDAVQAYGLVVVSDDDGNVHLEEP